MTTPKNTYAYNNKPVQKNTQQQRLAPFARPDNREYMTRLGELHRECKHVAREWFLRGFSSRVAIKNTLFFAAVNRRGLDFFDAQLAGLEALRDVRRELAAAVIGGKVGGA